MQIEEEKPMTNQLLEDELTALLELERVARQDSKMEESIRLLEEITELVWRAKDIDRLMELVRTLTKKRGQPIKGVTKMVTLCMSYISQIDHLDKRMEFVATMKEVTEKKIYLEVDYARCCMMIVKHKEKEGASQEDIIEAAKIMEKVQVETYGSMDKFEKLEFILYQMKLNIILEDFTKLIIVSKKVNTKFFDDSKMALLEVTFYLYCLHYHQHKNEYMQSADCLGKVYNALLKMEKNIAEDAIQEEGAPKEFDSMVLRLYEPMLDKTLACQTYLSMILLEEYSEEKIEKLKKQWENHQLATDDNQGLKSLINAFLDKELSSCNLKDYSLSDLHLFSETGLYNTRYHTQLEKQLIKKNLKQVSLFYNSIRFEKLAKLLRNNKDRIEDYLCELIFHNKVKCSIDRPAELILFRMEETEAEKIDNWVQNINEIVDLVDFVCERIEREAVSTKI